MSEWFKTDFKGVRYRKHPTRKHGVTMDRYFVITYKVNGKTISEAVGWASEGHKQTDANNLLCELKRNQKSGTGPCTLTEMRGQAENKKKATAKAKSTEALQTFRVFLMKFICRTLKPGGRWKQRPRLFSMSRRGSAP
ncbi:MAG: hypothetical protein V2B19_03070 [Pseudomonadota bacterium]